MANGGWRRMDSRCQITDSGCRLSVVGDQMTDGGYMYVLRVFKPADGL